jgi:hypothetical protein
MDESSLCRKLTFSQLEGTWKKERPKLKWLDGVLQDSDSWVEEGTRQG